MGAVTSILRAADDHALAACVLDSPFGDLKTVAEELVNRGRFKVPQFMVNMGIEVIRTEVKTRPEFDVAELMPIKSAPQAVCPALFGVASDDTFVLPHHTQDLHNAWAGERLLRVFEGGHNGVRPAWFLEEASDFLAERLIKAAGTKLKVVRRIPLGASTSKGSEQDGDGSPNGTAGAVTPRSAEGSNWGTRISLDAPPGSIASELVRMGFAEDAAAEAAKQSSTVEDAVAWLLQQSSGAIGAEEMRPAHHRSLDETVRSADGDSAAAALLRINSTGVEPGGADSSSFSQRPRSAAEASSPMQNALPRTGKPLLVAAPAAANAKRGYLGGTPSSTKVAEPPGANMVEQLLYLGFEQVQCETAAKQCLSIDAAVEWLSSQRATVQL